MKHIIILFTAICISQPAYTVNETDHENLYITKVEPYRDDNFNREKFLSFDGQNENSIYAPKEKRNDNAILILPGRMEPSIKYFELIYDIRNLPFDFFVLDHRGQGFSDRLLDDPMKGHVENFQDFTKDVDIVFKSYLKDYKKINILSHSMGGAIHLSFLQNYPGYKKVIEKNLTIAPMIDINFAPYKKWQAISILKIFDIVGQDNKYVLGGRSFNPEAKYENNRTTTSEVRWNKNHNFYLKYPELQLGSTTNRWTLQSHQATNRIIKYRSKLADLNLLIFQAENDSFVTNARNPILCGSIKKCRIINYKNAKHGIHSERDEIRDQFIAELIKYFK